jgi:hypothetical protein
MWVFSPCLWDIALPVCMWCPFLYQWIYPSFVIYCYPPIIYYTLHLTFYKTPKCSVNQDVRDNDFFTRDMSLFLHACESFSLACNKSPSLYACDILIYISRFPLRVTNRLPCMHVIFLSISVDISIICHIVLPNCRSHMLLICYMFHLTFYKTGKCSVNQDARDNDFFTRDISFSLHACESFSGNNLYEIWA